MEISSWQVTAKPTILVPAAQRFLMPPILIGLIGTLLLHALVVEAVYGGPFANMQLPEIQLSGQATINSKGGSDKKLLIVQLPVDAVPSGSFALDPGLLSQLRQPKFQVPLDVDQPAMIEELTLGEEDGSEGSGSNNGGDAEKMRLFGLYSGQMQARIERVWRRPRSPVGQPDRLGADVTFQCTAQIVQDSAGNVQEVLLPSCNGTSRWQASLIMAIREASPLPAPPERRVFSQSVTLHFIAFPFGKGQPDDGYEMAANPTVASSTVP